jgi:hypothetical protein
MTRADAVRITLAINVMAMCLLFVQPRVACACQGSSPSQVSATPVVESITDVTLHKLDYTQSGRHDPALRDRALRKRSQSP